VERIHKKKNTSEGKNKKKKRGGGGGGGGVQKESIGWPGISKGTLTGRGVKKGAKGREESGACVEGSPGGNF